MQTFYSYAFKVKTKSLQTFQIIFSGPSFKVSSKDSSIKLENCLVSEQRWRTGRDWAVMCEWRTVTQLVWILFLWQNNSKKCSVFIPCHETSPSANKQWTLSKIQVKQTVYDNHLIVWWRLLTLSTKKFIYLFLVDSFSAPASSFSLSISLSLSFPALESLCFSFAQNARVFYACIVLKYSCYWKHKRWWTNNFHIRCCVVVRLLLLCFTAKTFRIM